MTIITQPLTEKKFAKQQEPLVQHEVPPDRDLEGSPVIVTMKARRVSSTTTMCVFITALLVLTTGIIGGVYLYRQFTHYKLRHFRGWCGVPFPDSENGHRDQPHAESLFHQVTHSENGNFMSDSSANNYFEENFDLDLEYELYEQIEVPDFSHGRRGRFIHDFSVNKTGIIDINGRRCFVMPLNRSRVLPPHSLFDLIVKMRAGYYDVDTEVVRDTMRVITPPISNLRSVGYYIARECASLPTYRLEKVTSPVYKRSLDAKEKAVFIEFAGRKINEIDIMNLHEAIGAGSQP